MKVRKQSDFLNLKKIFKFLLFEEVKIWGNILGQMELEENMELN